MKTLEIAHGDLVLGPEGFATISGARKVKQDLAVAVREPYGSDRFHPRWGSLLGTYVGQAITEDLQMRVESEIHRVIANYMAVQQDQMSASAVNGKRSRYGTSEVIGDVRDIQVRQSMDRLHVKVILSTLSGESVSLVSTVRL